MKSGNKNTKIEVLKAGGLLFFLAIESVLIASFIELLRICRMLPNRMETISLDLGQAVSDIVTFSVILFVILLIVYLIYGLFFAKKAIEQK